MRTLFLTLITCLFVLPAHAKYSGGSGEPNDPYQIATAEDLMLLGDSPEDYAKHFILTADIDLDPNLPGRKVFDKAVIAPDTDPNDPYSKFQGTTFEGVFDGNGHTISHLTIIGKDYLGLFGELGWAEVKDVGVVDVNIAGSGDCIGGLVGYNQNGTLIRCYSTGTVTGHSRVGGLVGVNTQRANVTDCYSTGTVSGGSYVGGLVGNNSYSGSVTQCYSTGAVSGNSYVGGLVGSGYPARVTHCVWDTQTSGSSGSAGGVGLTTAEMMDPYMLGLNGFANDPNWVLDGGRDYPRLAWQGTAGQVIPESNIDWLVGDGTQEDPYRIDTAEQLVLLHKASILWDKHLVLGADIDLDPNLPGRQVFRQAVIQTFTGVFNGNVHTISNLTIGGNYLGLFGRLERGAEVKNLGVVDVNITGTGGDVGGLVGSNGGTVTQCYSTGAVSGNSYVGGLVGSNSGDVTGCYSTGAVSGTGSSVGGLVGTNGGDIADCYSTGAVSGTGSSVGGLVGGNSGIVTQCYSTGTVSGKNDVGGLVGVINYDMIVIQSYSTGAVSGNSCVGGLVGYSEGDVIQSYSTGAVSGNSYVGGLVGDGWWVLASCFWDIQTSGQTVSGGGTGLTTAEMQDVQTYQDAGWDFVGEIGNGTHEIWQMPEEGGYPVLTSFSGYTPPKLQGLGTPDDPYLISDAMELGAMIHYNPYAHYRLAASIDLSGVRWGTTVIPRFGGTFDGNHLTISHLTISHLTVEGGDSLGLFGYLGSGAEVKDLGVVDVNIGGWGLYGGGLAGANSGIVTNCYSTGAISGMRKVGGLAGTNSGIVTQCHSTGSVRGTNAFGLLLFGAGGLVGDNQGTVTQSYSTGTVSGPAIVGGLVGRNGDDATVVQCYSTAAVRGTREWSQCVGGLVGENRGHVTNCYSTGTVDGNHDVGGLVGRNDGSVIRCYSTGVVSGTYDVGGLVGCRGWAPNATACFWDTQTSGQTTSVEGTGKTTAEMQTAKTFLDAGWDFVDETTNGTEDLWWILEGKDYPRLWWQAAPQ